MPTVFSTSFVTKSLLDAVKVNKLSHIKRHVAKGGFKLTEMQTAFFSAKSKEAALALFESVIEIRPKKSDDPRLSCNILTILLKDKDAIIPYAQYLTKLSLNAQEKISKQSLLKCIKHINQLLKLHVPKILRKLSELGGGCISFPQYGCISRFTI